MSESRDVRPTELGGSDQRVLLLVSGQRDRELLATRLGDRYEVVAGEPDADWAEFDLCVVDAGTYREVAADLARRKEHNDAYLPVLLLVPDRGNTREAEWLAEELGGTVDDVLVVPAPKHELDARVDALLRARRQSRQLALYRRAMDEATLGITITDPDRPDNPIVYANDWFSRITGYAHEDILGQNCRFLQGAETDADTVAQIREAIDAEEPVTVELLNYRADGTPFWNLLTITPVRDPDGDVTHFLGFQRDVTDRVESAADLRSERELLERVFDTNPVGITVVDADGSIVRANRTAEDVLGLERSEITSRTFDATEWDIVDEDGDPVPPEDLPFARVMRTGEPVEDYQHGIRVDGETRWLSSNAAPLTDEDGTVESVVSTIQDITDRVERERELKRASLVLETMEDGVWTVDRDRQLTFVNDSVVANFPLDPDDLLGLPLEQVRHIFADDAEYDRYATALEDVLAGRVDEQSLDVTLSLPQGTMVANLRLAPIPGQDGPNGVVAVSSDITERVERERELERYEAIVETTSDLIYVLDRDGHFIRVNDAMVEASGYTRDELLGSHASLVADEETVELTEGHIRELLAADRDQTTFEATMLFADGIRREFAAGLAILRDDDGAFQGTVISAHDITELRESQRRLTVLDRVLRHNLRNRMNVVLGYAKELGNHPDGEVAELGCAIEDSARNLLQLSESAREFENVISGAAKETTTMDATALVAGAIEDARGEHPDARVSADLPDAAPVRAHETFELAVYELLENAIVHNDSDPPTVDVSVRTGDDAVAIRIADDGPGLNDVDRRALLAGSESPLEHTQGLGLWLVRWAVGTVGGELEIADNDPRGTVVTIRLPRAEE